MKRTTVKRAISLALATVMATSTMALSAVSTSAAESTKKISLTFKTGDIFLAGTDGAYSVVVYDEKGIASKKTHLDSDKNDFERTQKDTFYIDVPEKFGKVSKIDIKIEDYVINSWYLDYVDVKNDISSDTTRRFYAYDWIESDTTLKSTDIAYKVSVKTSNKAFAGTDANVYLHLYNDNNKKIITHNGSERICLDSNGNDFEKNNTDVFYITSPQKINTIEVELDHGCELECFGEEWHLDNIKIEPITQTTGPVAKQFIYKKWLKMPSWENSAYIYAPTSTKVLS